MTDGPKLPEGMTLEQLFEGVMLVDTAVEHSMILTKIAATLVDAIKKSVDLGDEIERKLDVANEQHVEGEFTPNDVAVITAAQAYMDAETEMLQLLLDKYIKVMTGEVSDTVEEQAEADLFGGLFPR